ncbi:(2Fe-2S)-binding protein [Candidatus Poriferisodalis sp.]|uniref:(2Fe-2S)-binding protein n=1 Tax=Candidatus Poriferisodalis sp. TaxID=3101277 RepID=UPI003B01B3AD
MTGRDRLSEVDVEVAVNGRPYRHRVPARLLLSDYIRDVVNLTGTHVGCEHGYCGACTVTVDGEAARSCLMFAAQADGTEIRTVEDLAPAGTDSLSPMQQSFHDHHALQCGFCTAGILMTLESVNPDDWRESAQIVELLSGNLCRCTGYQNIVAAVAHAWSSPQSSSARSGATTEAEAESGDAAP